MSNIQASGPFGDPDGARAELDDLLHRFVDFEACAVWRPRSSTQ